MSKILVLSIFMVQLPFLAVAVEPTKNNPCEIWVATPVTPATPEGKKRKFVNWGHRLGSDYFSTFAPKAKENSLIALRYSLEGLEGANGGKPIHDNTCFLHAEFDVGSTKDDKVVALHNRRICNRTDNDCSGVLCEKDYKECKGALCEKEYKVCKDEHAKGIQYIKTLDLEEIRRLPHGSRNLMPEVHEVFDLAAKLKIKKTISVDIKEIHSSKAKFALIAAIEKYREKYSKNVPSLNRRDKSGDLNDVRLITEIKGFQDSFALKTRTKSSSDNAAYWCDTLKRKHIKGILSYEYRGENFCDLLSFAAVNRKVYKVVDVTCTRRNSDGGCKEKMQCPAKMKIGAVRASCNLETTKNVELPKWNLLTVSVPSNSPQSSQCAANDVSVQTGAQSLLPLQGEKFINLSCNEKDRGPKGGDCQIVAQAVCVPDAE